MMQGVKNGISCDNSALTMLKKVVRAVLSRFLMSFWGTDTASHEIEINIVVIL